MTPNAERRLLQVAIGVAALVPLSAGAIGIFRGPEMLAGVAAPVPVDLDSHYRYLSGLLLGLGLVFVAVIPGIDRHGAVVRAAGAIVIVGGLARLLSLWEAGIPGVGHVFGMAMELAVVPAIMLWQARVAKRTGSA